MSTVAIIQGRVGSTRFPKKIFAELCGKPFIWHVVNRLTFCKNIDKIVLATTTNPSDDELENWAKSEGIACFRGSENNVLERFYNAAKFHEAKIVVRITADDPFKDPVIIDKVIDLLKTKKKDFAYNNYPPTFPEGLDTEVFTFQALKKAYLESKDDFEKEHVTQYLYRHPELFTQTNFSNSENLSHLRLTVDTINDFNFTKFLYNKLYDEGRIFYLNQIIEVINKYPEMLNLNSEVERSSMYKNL